MFKIKVEDIAAEGVSYLPDPVGVLDYPNIPGMADVFR